MVFALKTSPKKRNDLPFQTPLLERVWNGGTFHRSIAERLGTISSKYLKNNEKKRNAKTGVLERPTNRSAPPAL